MPGLFIDVQVDAEVAANAKLAAKLVEVCPVDIFEQPAGRPLRICDENVDECVLCDLCVEAAPKGTVKVVKLYE